MPLKKLRSLDSELQRIDSEYVNVNVPEDSEHAKEIKNMKREGISLEEIKEAA
jgi:hypothetical protein